MTIELYSYLVGCVVTFCIIIVVRVIQFIANREIELTYLDILVALLCTALSWVGLIHPIFIAIGNIPWSKTLIKVKKKKKEKKNV